MEKTTETVQCNSLESIPDIETLTQLPRKTKLLLKLGPQIAAQQQKMGTYLKEKLPGFQVGIYSNEPTISISKLISDKEIEANCHFFETCAIDYRELAQKLIFELADTLNITINQKFPLLTFNPLKSDAKIQTGTIPGWNYYLHGYHCAFVNKATKQSIEVPLVFGMEFGDLDPYFFSLYITSTAAYKPLPVNIYEPYADGLRIIEKMLMLGKFEKINSNITNHFGVAVTNRPKINIEIYKED